MALWVQSESTPAYQGKEISGDQFEISLVSSRMQIQFSALTKDSQPHTAFL